MSKMNRWDKARESDPAPPPPMDPNAGGMTQVQFFKTGMKSEAQKLQEQRKLAEKLRNQ